MSICGRIILTLSDAPPDAATSGPAFAEPWQARAFAIALLASKQGCFTWSEWTHALGRELRGAREVDTQGAAPDYFNCWLAALQSLLVGKGAIAWDELVERRDEYEDAYRRTPHGVPVSLCRLAE